MARESQITAVFLVDQPFDALEIVLEHLIVPLNEQVGEVKQPQLLHQILVDQGVAVVGKLSSVLASVAHI